MDLSKVLSEKEAELNQVKDQMKKVEDEMIRLRKVNDQLLTKGIELQGAIRTLNELITPKTEQLPVTA